MKFRALIASLAVTATALTVGGCAYFDKSVKDVAWEFRGVKATIETFDVNATPLDRITGSSIHIEIDDRFDITDAEGNVTKESSVLKLTVGKSPMYHVGSSLIMTQSGLESILNDENARAEVNSTESAVPFLTRLRTSFDEFFTGKEYTVLVRSQEGTPIAVYTGEKVSSYSAEGIPNATVLMVDGKRLFIYRCDYTIYSTELIAQE
ncbi:DUF5052 family protein [Actinomyces mediterranea]|uniref:DUF5052 family protein n=1 Tax=Actinomyces mediterranea TaxID=1871028 RepID=UPI0009713F9A|nr:DUF5052 family protein [Actinomyces mediterranea]